MLDTLQAIDTSIFLFFNGLRSHTADIFFYWVSNRFAWIPLYAFLLFMIIKKEKKSSWIVVIMLILSIFLSDQTCNLMKRNICRQRPSHNTELAEKIHLVDYPDGNAYRGGQFGFPSSHAANSIVVAVFAIFYAAPKKKWAAALLVFWSLLLGYSRIYLGVHYPFDLLTGYTLGLICSILMIFCTEKIKNSLYKTSPL